MKKFFIAFVLILIIFLIVSGVSIYKPSIQLPTSNLFSHSKQENAWKKYVGYANIFDTSKGKFSIQYPPQAIIKDTSIYLSGDINGPIFSLTAGDIGGPIDGTKEFPAGTFQYQWKEGGQASITGKDGAFFIFTLHNFSENEDKMYQEIFDEMLTSFRFE